MDTQNLSRTIKSFFNIKQGRASYETIRKRVEAGARIDGIHVCQLIAAMIIASIGLNVDSTEAVIGAMLICPLMGSVMAIAYATATTDTKYLREVLLGLGIQIIVCLATSTIYFLISPLSTMTNELLSNTSPTLWDVLIACTGGFAGALGMSRQQEPATLLSGVAVATALMPPLCATGYGLAGRDLPLALSALYEFFVNVAFISFTAELVLLWLRVPPLLDLNGDGVVTPEEEATFAKRNRITRRRLVAFSLLFALPCVFFSGRMVQRQLEENGAIFEEVDVYDTEETTRELELLYPEVCGYRVGEVDSYNTDEDQFEQSVVATVEIDEQLDQKDKDAIEELVRLHVPNVEMVRIEMENDS